MVTEATKMSLSAKREYLARIHGRYQRAGRPHKTRILQEFCATCGYHRKSALRLLHRPLASPSARRRPGPKPTYDPVVLLPVLKVIWLASDQLCSKLLKAALPAWLEYYERHHAPLVAECSGLLRRRVDACRPSPLSQFESLAFFDLYAGDGHYLEHATQDPMIGETRWPTGPFFALNLKSQSLFPLMLADLAGRKKEHDVRALKRQSVAMLRQGAGKGRKVLWVWDKAGIDLPFWQARKASGIYFLSLRKASLCLAVEQERAIDFAHPINQGVTGDRVVKDRRGLRVREITFCNPCDGQVYVYLTSEMTLEPGLLVLLYKTRWEIEKVFDKTKTKLQEQNSWATTPAAKQMQSHFVALVHNLLLLVQDLHQ